MDDILGYLKSLKGKIDESATEAEQGLDNQTARLLAKVDPELDEAKALEEARRIRELGSQGGQMAGSLNIVRSPAATALMRAKQSMQAANPGLQKELVDKLSEIKVDPLPFQSGETFFPREVLQRFKRTAK